MKEYYIIKKDNITLTAETKAGAFEAWDSLGRYNTIIEHYFYDTDSKGVMKKYIHVADKMTRKTLKTGEIKYHCHFVNA